VNDIIHCVVAVGSSTSLAKAQEFAQKCAGSANHDPTKIHCYGSYKELLADPAVSIIYVATPHTLHHANVIASLQAGKHVLCEKPFMISRAEAAECVQLAREKNLFLMEALWSRFFPSTLKFQELISQGKIGKVFQVTADLGCDFQVDKISTTNRILDPALGGGALLDLGVYPISWAYIALYALNGLESPHISSSMFLTTVTHVDRLTTALFTFKRAQAVAFISCNVDRDTASVVEVLGTKGMIRVRTPLYRPTALEVKVDGVDQSPQTLEFNVAGNGLYFQADEAARCIRAGKKESPLMTWSESIEIMRAMDEIRQQGGLVYPNEKK